MTRAGVTYQQWQLERIERVGPDELAIHLTGTGNQGLMQQRENVYGHAYVVGTEDIAAPKPASAIIRLRVNEFLRTPRLQVQMQIAVPEDVPNGTIDWLLERHSWQPHKGLTGWRYFAQRWGSENGGWDSPLDSPTGFSTTDAMHVGGNQLVLGQGQPRGFGGPAMDFCYGPNGAFALWRDPQEPGAYIRGHVTKRPDQTFLAITDQHFIRRNTVATTPWLSMVVNPSITTRR
jgi:hypothetical protein